jgi:hypothetical protein
VTDPGAGEPWRALVAFTTSNRSAYVKRCFPELARAALGDQRLDLLVALDGDDAETRAVCAEWNIPLLYSDEREGVGLSKNRVLEHFPDYDYYFFLEDDVEVLDGTVFARHVELMQASGIQHMSLYSQRGELPPSTGETIVRGQRIVHYPYGHADLNAFTRASLERVGGWHPLFATYRRWGHTEHSYRFARVGLAPAAFNVAVDLADTCIWHSPPSVTSWVGLAAVDVDGIAQPERELIQQELTHVPLQTIAASHLENRPPGQVPDLARAVRGRRGRYPLLHGADRRLAQSDFLLWRFETASAWRTRLAAFLAATVLYPNSIAVRHAAKTRLQAVYQHFRRGG